MTCSDLIEHPEGGRYREVYRSGAVVQAPDGRQKAALTHIYFSLNPGEVSHFHRVAGDEVWNLYRGAGLRLVLWDGVSAGLRSVELSAASGAYCHVVPANCWQAAFPLSDTVLVGCSVAPGFEFADFELMRRTSSAAQALLAAHPDSASLIQP